MLSDAVPRTVSKRLLRWSLWLALMLVAAGCGNTGQHLEQSGPGEATPMGTLTFSSLQAPFTRDEPLPADLRFEFFDGPNGTGHLTQGPQVREFADSLTISPVLITSRSVVITALTEGGVPLREAVVEVTVPAGGQAMLSLTDAVATAIRPANLSLGPAEATLPAGGTLQCVAAVTFSNGDSLDNPPGVEFSAVGPASISARGLVIAGYDSGRVSVEASYEALSDTVVLFVDPHATPVLASLTIEPGSATGKQTQLVVTGQDQFGRPFSLSGQALEWSSRDSQVATIDLSGLLTATGSGSTTITVRVGSVTGTSEVMVSGSFGEGGISLLNETRILIARAAF